MIKNNGKITPKICKRSEIAVRTLSANLSSGVVHSLKELPYYKKKLSLLIITLDSRIPEGDTYIAI